VNKRKIQIRIKETFADLEAQTLFSSSLSAELFKTAKLPTTEINAKTHS
jgi:hypothetical protein